MKNKILLLVALITTAASAQQSKDSISNERRFSFSIKLGNYIQQIEENENHITNEPSYSGAIIAEYRLFGNTSIETGFHQIDKISFSGLSYDSFKIPLTFSTDMTFNNNGSKPNTKIVASLGTYLRSITNLNNNTNLEYDENSVFGFHASLGIKHDLSERAFVNLSFQVDRDFNDLLETENSSIRIESGYGLFLGFGIRL
jgi:hypothetical protein